MNEKNLLSLFFAGKITEILVCSEYDCFIDSYFDFNMWVILKRCYFTSDATLHTDVKFAHSIPSQSIICIPFILTLACFRRWNISRWKTHTPLINVTRRKAENFLNLKSVAASLAVSWPAEQQPELLRHKSDCDREDYFTRQLANIRLSKQIRWLFRDRDWVPSC